MCLKSYEDGEMLCLMNKPCNRFAMAQEMLDNRTKPSVPETKHHKRNIQLLRCKAKGPNIHNNLERAFSVLELCPHFVRALHAASSLLMASADNLLILSALAPHRIKAVEHRFMRRTISGSGNWSCMGFRMLQTRLNSLCCFLDIGKLSRALVTAASVNDRSPRLKRDAGESS